MLRRCSLTLDGLFEFARDCAPSNACCACTHYLVFKEPEWRRRMSRRQSPPIGIFRRFQGNLLRLLPATTLVKPFLSGGSRNAARSSACISNGIETDSSLSGWRPSGEPFKITGSPTLCQSPPNRTHTVQVFETTLANVYYLNAMNCGRYGLVA